MGARHYLQLRSAEATVAGESSAPAGVEPKAQMAHQRPRRNADGWLTVADIQERFQVSETTVRRMVAGQGFAPLRAYRYGVHLRFKEADVLAWETQHMRAVNARGNARSVILPRSSAARQTNATRQRGGRGHGDAPGGADLKGSEVSLQPGAAETAPGPEIGGLQGP